MVNPPVPRWLWRFALLGLAILLLAGITGALLLALGAADVPPLGALRWQQEASPGGCLDIHVLDMTPLDLPATLELTAVSRAEFAAWGLWLESPGAADLSWLALPPGYYRHAGQTTPFFHIRADENTLRLDLSAAGYRLWFNREQAASGPLLPLTGPWGLVTEGDVCWRRAAIYAENGPSPAN